MLVFVTRGLGELIRLGVGVFFFYDMEMGMEKEKGSICSVWPMRVDAFKRREIFLDKNDTRAWRNRHRDDPPSK